MAKPDRKSLKHLALNLKSARERAGLTQEAAAEQIGNSAIFISECERGVKAPSVAMLVHLAAAYKVRVDTLVSGMAVLLNPRPPQRRKPKQVAKGKPPARGSDPRRPRKAQRK